MVGFRQTTSLRGMLFIILTWSLSWAKCLCVCTADTLVYVALARRAKAVCDRVRVKIIYFYQDQITAIIQSNCWRERALALSCGAVDPRHIPPPHLPRSVTHSLPAPAQTNAHPWTSTSSSAEGLERSVCFFVCRA